MTAREIILKLEELGLTQNQIAKASGLSQSSISLIKNSKRTQIKFSTYESLLSVFQNFKNR
ncbi:helix-turn-helix domain-containing protein [Oligella urethralis]|uniref:helix-turn-helix domain-containing protein n=1 Tax=Oligella urethralis TaxID=90245 RepID=UPI00352AE437